MCGFFLVASEQDFEPALNWPLIIAQIWNLKISFYKNKMTRLIDVKVKNEEKIEKLTDQVFIWFYAEK